ncbi:MAG: M20 family metallopeptidase, partial [Candidatus Geothermarchaeales archaeon]
MSRSAEVIRLIRRERVVDLAKRLIEIPSLTTEEGELADFLTVYFEEIGLEVKTMEVESGRSQVLGILKGEGKKSLMLNGHLDMDPLSGGWGRVPFSPSVEDGRLFGAGVVNMKAGLAALVSAARAISEAGTELLGDLWVAAVVGELQGGVGTKKLLDEGYVPSAAVVAEPTHLDAVTVHAGLTQIALNVKGRSVHTSKAEEGINAILKMARVVQALEGISFTHTPREDLPGLPRLLTGSIVGGRGESHELRGAYNVPDNCTAIVDVRFLPGQTVQGIVLDIEKLLNSLRSEDPELDVSIEEPPPPEFRCNRLSMAPLDVPRDEKIVRTIARSHEAVTGSSPLVGASPPFSYTGNDTAQLW